MNRLTDQSIIVTGGASGLGRAITRRFLAEGASLCDLLERQGSMIFTASNAGRHPGGGGALYTASKHAVVGLTRQLAHELAPKIRVNAVAPGPMATNLSGPAGMGLDENSISVDVLAEIVPDKLPVGRLITPEEYAGAYVFLASRDDNIPCTGTVLECDGGVGARGVFAVRGGDDL